MPQIALEKAFYRFCYWSSLNVACSPCLQFSWVCFSCYFCDISLGVFNYQEKSLLLLRLLRYLRTFRGPSLFLLFLSLEFCYICYFYDCCEICHGRFQHARKILVTPAPISSRFLCPRPPLLLSSPNQNRHATQAKSLTSLSAMWSKACPVRALFYPRACTF